jgi:hypothetical protein
MYVQSEIGVESGREGGVLGGLFALLKFCRVALRVQVNISRFFRVAHQSTHPCNHAAVARAAWRRHLGGSFGWLHQTVGEVHHCAEEWKYHVM